MCVWTRVVCMSTKTEKAHRVPSVKVRYVLWRFGKLCHSLATEINLQVKWKRKKTVNEKGGRTSLIQKVVDPQKVVNAKADVHERHK